MPRRLCRERCEHINSLIFAVYRGGLLDPRVMLDWHAISLAARHSSPEMCLLIDLGQGIAIGRLGA